MSVEHSNNTHSSNLVLVAMKHQFQCDRISFARIYIKYKSILDNLRVVDLPVSHRPYQKHTGLDINAASHCRLVSTRNQIKAHNFEWN